MFDIDSPFTMVVAISVGAGVLNNYLRLKRNDGQNAAQDGELDALRAEVKALRDRVSVLEKIATDEDRKLRSEISRLG